MTVGRASAVAARRERVLAAAELVLAEVGMSATMDDIADAARIGRRTLFRYSPTREGLIAAAIERSYQRVDEEVSDEAHLEAGPPPLREAVHGPAVVALGWSGRPPRWLVDTFGLLEPLHVPGPATGLRS